MNNFDEHTWTVEQRNLDGRIAIEFEALEGSMSLHESSGEPMEAWLAGAKDTAKALRAQIARIAHEGRRQHWERELQRIGIPKSEAETAALSAFEAAGKAADAAVDAAADLAADKADEAKTERAADRAEAAAPKRGGFGKHG